jgi:hypothetical protein
MRDIRIAIFFAVLTACSVEQLDDTQSNENVRATSVPVQALNPTSCLEHVIVVLDRSSRLSKASQEVFNRGVNRLFEDPVIHGEIEAFEVRDTTLGFEAVTERVSVLSPPALDPVRVPAVNCNKINDDAYLTDDEREKIGICRSNNQRNKNTYEQQFKEVNEYRKERAQIISEFKDRLAITAATPRPTSSQTAITGALGNILEARCRKKTCGIFIFSDMIDVSLRQSLGGGPDLDFSVIAEDGRSAARAYTNISDADTLLSGTQSILVWGMGRDETSNGELTPQQNRVLRTFWQSYMESLGIASDRIIFGYEFPLDLGNSNFPADRSQCGAVQL